MLSTLIIPLNYSLCQNLLAGLFVSHLEMSRGCTSDPTHGSGVLMTGFVWNWYCLFSSGVQDIIQLIELGYVGN